MSLDSNCGCGCPTPVLSLVPGVEGVGTPGTNGVNAYTITSGTAGPFNKGDTGITITVADSTPFPVGSNIAIEDASGTAVGYFLLTAKAANQLTLTYLDIAANTDASSIATNKLVNIAGPEFTPGTLPNGLAESIGTPSDTIVSTAGVFTIPFFVNLAQITATTILSFTPGYAFKVLGIQFTTEVAVTTAAKTVTLTPQIDGVSTTGGALVLTSANCTPKGATVTGSAITAANSGTSAQTLSLIASSVTAFSEGSGWILLRVQNVDSANAFASLAEHVNDLITALS